MNGCRKRIRVRGRYCKTTARSRRAAGCPVEIRGMRWNPAADGNLGYAERQRMEASAGSWERRRLRCSVQILASGILGIAPLIMVCTNSNTRAVDMNQVRSEAILERPGGRGVGRELCRMAKSEHRANQKGWREDNVRAAVAGGDRDTGVQARLWGVGGGVAVAHRLY